MNFGGYGFGSFSVMRSSMILSRVNRCGYCGADGFGEGGTVRVLTVLGAEEGRRETWPSGRHGVCSHTAGRQWLLD